MIEPCDFGYIRCKSNVSQQPAFAPYKVVLAEYTPAIVSDDCRDAPWRTLAQWGMERRAELETFMDDFDLCVFSDELATCWAEVMAESPKLASALKRATPGSRQPLNS